MHDGTPYAICPFLLYCDEFNESLGKKGSVGACYMLSFAFPADMPLGSSVIRVLTATIPVISTNEGLIHIATDIAKSLTIGYEEFNPDGNAVRLFLDFAGFVSDYPVCSHTLDVASHASDVPCHLRSFRRVKTFKELAIWVPERY